MKILLVNPYHLEIGAPYAPKIILEKNGKYEPLGLLYIASYVKKTLPSVKIKIFDSQLFGEKYIHYYKNELQNYDPDIIGISSFTPTLFRTITLAKIGKEIKPNVHINIGGHHTNIYPEETLQLPWIDSVTIGEGEITFSELVGNILEKKPLDGIKGLWFKRNNTVIKNPYREYIKKLDILPFPDRSLIPKGSYYFIVDKPVLSTSMITSRGCPYDCIFCDTHRKTYVQRSPKNIVDEMEECIQLGFDYINFNDDTFNLIRRNVIALCKEITQRRLKTKWAFKGRVDLIDLELAQLLKDAGCDRVHLGIESGSDRMLTLLKKGITTEEVQRTVKILKSVGVEVLGFFMIGLPYETTEEVLKTINFSIELDLDYAQFTVLYPFPGTELYQLAVKVGAIEENYFKDYMKEPLTPSFVKRWETTISDKEIKKLVKLAYRKFYLRPAYILKIFKKNHRHIKSLKNVFYAGLQVLKFVVGVE